MWPDAVAVASRATESVLYPGGRITAQRDRKRCRLFFSASMKMNPAMRLRAVCGSGTDMANSRTDGNRSVATDSPAREPLNRIDLTRPNQAMSFLFRFYQPISVFP